MPDRYRETKKNWDKKNQNKVKKSKSEYDQKKPVWAFRPTPEMIEWLEKERWNDENGKPETNAALIIRKLEELMEMKY